MQHNLFSLLLTILLLTAIAALKYDMSFLKNNALYSAFVSLNKTDKTDKTDNTPNAPAYSASVTHKIMRSKNIDLYSDYRSIPAFFRAYFSPNLYKEETQGDYVSSLLKAFGTRPTLTVDDLKKIERSELQEQIDLQLHYLKYDANKDQILTRQELSKGLKENSNFTSKSQRRTTPNKGKGRSYGAHGFLQTSHHILGIKPDPKNETYRRAHMQHKPAEIYSDYSYLTKSSNKSRHDLYMEIQELMLLDQNDDDALSLEELKEIPDEKRHDLQQSPTWQKMHTLISLDGQKTITRGDFIHLAKKAFRTVDLNGNNRLSNEELHKFLDVQHLLLAEESKQKFKAHHKARLSSDCFPSNDYIPDNLIVYGVAKDYHEQDSYIGETLPFSISSNGRAAKKVDLIVNEERGPVALVLLARASTIWNIKRTPKTKIHSVLLLGNKRQELAGIANHVPYASHIIEGNHKCAVITERHIPHSMLTRDLTYEQVKKYDPNGNQKYMSTDHSVYHVKAPPPPKVDFAKEVISTHFPKKAAELRYYHKTSTYILGDKHFDKSTLIQDGKRVSDFHDKGQKLIGEVAILHLVKTGKLRPATIDDIDAVYRFMGYKYFRKNRLKTDKNGFIIHTEELYDKDKLDMSLYRNTYVVLDRFTIPENIGNFEFIVPKGSPHPIPQAQEKAALIYDFNQPRP